MRGCSAWKNSCQFGWQKTDGMSCSRFIPKFSSKLIQSFPSSSHNLYRWHTTTISRAVKCAWGIFISKCKFESVLRRSVSYRSSCRTRWGHDFLVFFIPFWWNWSVNTICLASFIGGSPDSINPMNARKKPRETQGEMPNIDPWLQDVCIEMEQRRSSKKKTFDSD